MITLRKIKVETACGDTIIVDVETDQEITSVSVVPKPVDKFPTGSMKLSKLVSGLQGYNRNHRSWNIGVTKTSDGFAVDLQTGLLKDRLEEIARHMEKE